MHLADAAEVHVLQQVAANSNFANHCGVENIPKNNYSSVQKQKFIIPTMSISETIY